VRRAGAFFHSRRQLLAKAAIESSRKISTWYWDPDYAVSFGMLLLIRCSSSGVGATAAVEGDDRVSGTDADRDANISHNGSSRFGGNADNSETADLRPFPAPIPAAGLPGLILVGGGLLSDGGRRSVRSRIANAKSLGWAIYAAGFAIWLFGYLSVGPRPSI
jgi:hypothetical protein